MVVENSIVIDLKANRIRINKMIYSNFIEHLGDCIHNGIWTYDPVNVPLIKNNPFLKDVRVDVLQAVKDLKPTIIRAFGGCYSDVYHWKDAIGSRDSRKIVRNLQWTRFFMKFIPGKYGPKIKNQFGTDEFLHFCEEVGAESYLNVNYSTGTPEEAAEWVEYCNGSAETEFGSLRSKNGRRETYNVKYWGIANEIWGFQEVGREKNPENYAKKYLKFAKAMRKKDSNIKLIAVGWHKSSWNQAVLKGIGEDWVDFLSIHHYIPFPLGIGILFGKKHPHKEKKYYSLMATSRDFEFLINKAWKDIITALGDKTHVRIAFDEWGIWYKIKDIIRTNFNLQDALCTASILMSFQKLSEKSPMANWAQLVNVLGPIQTDPDGIILNPVYFALKMFVDNSYTNLIDSVIVKCEGFDSKKFGAVRKHESTPYIDCNATIDDYGNKFSVFIINKHIVDDLDVELNIKNSNLNDKGIKLELNSKSPFDYNTINNREKIKIKESEINNIKSKIKIKLPAHSIIILKLSQKKN